MGAAALDTARPIGEVLARAEPRLFELAAERQRGDLEQISQAVVDLLAEIEAVSTGQQESRLKTGFKELDRRTSGFKPGQMIVIAARPSVGKSAFATNIAQHVALTLRRSVGFFEVEMAKGELIGRMLSGAAHIPFGIIQGHYRLSRAERDALHEAGEALAQAPLFIDDSDTLTPTDLRSKARKLKAQRPDLALIVVDYLGLMETGGKSENRNQEISQISRSIKRLARELGIPIIALSQLNRDTEKRTGPAAIPRLSDLRDSGNLAQDADIVIFPHRQMNKGRDNGAAITPVTVRIGKLRNGQVGDFEIGFTGDYCQFVNLEKQ